MARILIVDDVPMLRALLREVLEVEGHAVSEAGDGAEALALLAQEPFDIALVDMVMPNVDGIETVRRIRQAGGGLGIIAMSGGAADLPAGMALSIGRMYGADRLLLKPFENRDVVQAVAEMLAGR